MTPIPLNINTAGCIARIHISDLNRLRWTLVAMRINPSAFQCSGIAAAKTALVFDAQTIIRLGMLAPPPDSRILLWDGLNGFVELMRLLPQLASRKDINYLYVGVFPEVLLGFPSNSMPLFPDKLPDGQFNKIAQPQTPRWPSTLGVARGWMRPLRNAWLAPSLHSRLSVGGNIVFCGLVRPNAAVLDSFFQGSSLGELRKDLDKIIGLDWRLGGEIGSHLQKAFTAIRASRPRNSLDFSAIYSVVNILHRLGTLANLMTMTNALIVNEYGFHEHFNPYDTRAYPKNCYIDFGSLRGVDLVYPRSVDLWLNDKTAINLRLMPAGISLSNLLQNTTDSAFWARCERDASLINSTLCSMQSASRVA